VRSLGYGAFALVANAGLLFLISRAQAGTPVRPVKELWVVREVFQPAPPPRAQVPAEDAPRSVPDQPSSPQELAPATAMEAAPADSFVPRTSLPSFDIGQSGVGGGPAVPLPFGLPGEVVQPQQGSETQTAALSLQQVDRPPQPTVTPLPPYPEWGRQGRLTGVVLLKFVVKADGSVGEVTVVSVDGDTRFGPIAVLAVQGWRFEPAVYNGKNVAVRVSQRVRFRLVDER